MAEHNRIGALGEQIAAQWAVSQGMELVERNYLRKWGEIDIVARLPEKIGETNEILRFIEVKSVSYETLDELKWAVSHETWRPEDNVHKNKQDRFKRAIQTWISENEYAGMWQIDILTVRMVPREKYALVKLLENVVFE